VEGLHDDGREAVVPEGKLVAYNRGDIALANGVEFWCTVRFKRQILVLEWHLGFGSLKI
jgi:hypothetical protein